MRRVVNYGCRIRTAGIQLEWRLFPLMAAAGIRTAAALAVELRSVGIEISRAHAARLVKEAPQRLSLELLGGLVQILGCQPGDLLRVTEESADTRAQGPRGGKPKEAAGKSYPPSSGSARPEGGMCEARSIAERLGMPLATVVGKPGSKN